MIEINTIDDFRGLSPVHQQSILKSLRTIDRLDDWLNTQNGKTKNRNAKPYSYTCGHCAGDGSITVHPRDGADIHPSQIHKCLKKLWLDCSYTTVQVPVTDDQGQVVGSQFKEVPYSDYAEENIPSRIRKIFMMGHGWHDQIQAAGAKGAWGPKKNYHAEVRIDPDQRDEYNRIVNPRAEEYWIKGHVDALLDPYIIKAPNIGEVAIRVVHEYKTINSNGYKSLTNKPKSDHMWQATIYSAMLNVPIVVYIYTNKDNCQQADFPIAFDQNLWSTIEKKIRHIQMYVEGNQCPPWEETNAVLNPRECIECPYLRICDPPQPQVKKLSAIRR